jgi:hypothetical protein
VVGTEVINVAFVDELGAEVEVANVASVGELGAEVDVAGEIVGALSAIGAKGENIDAADLIFSLTRPVPTFSDFFWSRSVVFGPLLKNPIFLASFGPSFFLVCVPTIDPFSFGDFGAAFGLGVGGVAGFVGGAEGKVGVSNGVGDEVPVRVVGDVVSRVGAPVSPVGATGEGAMVGPNDATGDGGPVGAVGEAGASGCAVGETEGGSVGAVGGAKVGAIGKVGGAAVDDGGEVGARVGAGGGTVTVTPLTPANADVFVAMSAAMYDSCLAVVLNAPEMICAVYLSVDIGAVRRIVTSKVKSKTDKSPRDLVDETECVCSRR